MKHSRLSDFVKKVSSRGRVTFGDIKRLQRDLLRMAR